MPHTKQSCFDNGAAAAKTAHPSNPFKEGSWQAVAWAEGFRTVPRKTLADVVPKQAVFAGASNSGDNLAPFPARMPAPTREHLKRLNTDALTTKDSTRALRLDNKITALYQRYA